MDSVREVLVQAERLLTRNIVFTKALQGRRRHGP